LISPTLAYSNAFQLATISSSNQQQKITDIINLINESVIEMFLRDLISIGPRMTGTYGCEKAGDFIYNTFLSFGLTATKYPWSGFGNRWHRGYYKSENIEGILEADHPVSDEIIVFNAHYDTVEDIVGANDDGSGVVAVLAAAYALSHFSFDRTIVFVTFSGEEIGLLGSEHYVKHLYDSKKDVLVEFNADMVGVANTKEEGRSIRLSYSEDAPWIIDHIRNLNETYEEFHLNITGTYPYDRTSSYGGSDYYYFIRYGYESISFWQATHDPNMHTPEDNFENVNICYLVNTTRLIAATIATIADENDRPIKVTIESPQKGTLYYHGRLLREYDEDKTIILDNKWVYLDVKTFDADIEKIEFYIDEKRQHTTYDIPHVWNMNCFSFGSRQLTVIAYDTKGRTSTDQITVKFYNPLRSN
jgi:hypothetical protein